MVESKFMVKREAFTRLGGASDKSDLLATHDMDELSTPPLLPSAPSDHGCGKRN